MMNGTKAWKKSTQKNERTKINEPGGKKLPFVVVIVVVVVVFFVVYFF